MDEEIDHIELKKRGQKIHGALFDGLRAYDVEIDKVDYELRKRINELCASLSTLPTRIIPDDDDFKKRIAELWRNAATKNFSTEREQKLSAIKGYIAETIPVALPEMGQAEVEDLIDNIARDEDRKRKQRED